MPAALARTLGPLRARLGRVTRGLAGPLLAGLLLTSNAIDTARLSQTAPRLGPSAVHHTQALLQDMSALAGAGSVLVGSVDESGLATESALNAAGTAIAPAA